MTKTQLSKTLNVYHGAKLQEKQSKEKQEELRPEILEGIEEFGEREDSKTVSYQSKDLVAKVVTVAKKSFSAEAADILDQYNVLAEACNIVPDMKKVQRLVTEGLLPAEVVDQLIEETTYPRLTVSEKRNR